ncbi:MAG: class I SAM-dependent methyltransferase [Halanaerobium sp.]|nr:class I SAM-dependent methyltransferase [Halanaerobium sp.]
MGKKILDFGPGDGWPSLLLAPFAGEVVGLDSSARRVETCKENARRMGLKNADFYCYTSGGGLPFPDETFSGIVASSSIEQTPNPEEIIHEFYRVLRPGGRLRFRYEALGEYQGGQERDIWIAEVDEEESRIILFDRHIEDEYVDQYAITLTISREELIALLSDGEDISFRSVTVQFLADNESRITNIQKLRTVHPSGKTYSSWLQAAGFTKIFPTHSGGSAAGLLYKQLAGEGTLDLSTLDMEAVDKLIKPVVRVAIKLEAPLENDPALTAVKG